MKSVVVATRAIAEVLDAYKRSVSADNARHHVDHLKSDLSDCLKDLMVETKAYATHTGPNTEMVPRVLASSDRLLHVIYGIVKLLGIKSHPAPDTTEQSRGFADERTLVMKTTKASPGYPYEELKVCWGGTCCF